MDASRVTPSRAFTLAALLALALGPGPLEPATLAWAGIFAVLSVAAALGDLARAWEQGAKEQGLASGRRRP